MAFGRAGSIVYRIKGYQTNTPPGSPDEGDCYLIGAAPTGGWVGFAGQLATYFAGKWWYQLAAKSGGSILVDTISSPSKIYYHDDAAPAEIAKVTNLGVLTTKGDLIARGASIAERLGVGTDGKVLTAKSSEATGLSWETVGATPAGNTGEIQYNNAGAAGGIANVETDGTHLTLVETTTAPTASATGVIPWALDFGNSNLLMYQQASGSPQSIMSLFPLRRISWCGPQASTTIAQFGSSHTLTGTVSHPAFATTNLLAQMGRFIVTSAAGAGSNANFRDQARAVWRGNAAGLGGFFLVGVIATSTAVAQQRAFFGLQSSAGAIGNVEPSTLTQQIGFQYNSAETTWRIGHNDGAGAATRVDLGANFPVDATSVYRMMLNAKPNGSEVDYYIENVGTGNIARGTLSSDLPTSTTGLFAQAWVNNGSTASAVVIDSTGFTLMSDT